MDRNKEININSFMIAVLMLVTTLSVTLSIGFGISSGANSLVLMVLLVCNVYKLMLKQNVFPKISLGVLIIVAGIVIVYLLTKFFSPYKCAYSIIQILFYAIIPVISVNLKFETKKVLDYCVYLSLFTIFGGNNFFSLQYSFMNQADMGYIYPIIASLIPVLFHARYFWRSAKWYTYVCYAYNLYLLGRTLMTGNRGAILSLMLCAFVLVFYSINKDGSIKRQTVKHSIYIIAAGIIIFAILNNPLSVIRWCTSFCERFLGSVPSFFIKMERYIGFGDISNGRDVVFDYVYSGIKKSPWIGNGIGTFSDYTGGVSPYPHNYIFQFIYEIGILFAIVPIGLSIQGLVRVCLAKFNDYNEYIFMAVLVMQVFPKLLLSADPWLGTAIWMLIAYVAVINRNIRGLGRRVVLRRI